MGPIWRRTVSCLLGGLAGQVLFQLLSIIKRDRCENCRPVSIVVRARLLLIQSSIFRKSLSIWIRVDGSRKKAWIG